MSTVDTKERILAAAENLFAEHGFAATSLRKITGAAKANLASVHYHFGSKEALIGAVFARRFGRVNEERLAGLDQVLAEAGGEPPRVEDILRSFVTPMARMARERHLVTLRRLLMRLHVEPDQDEIIRIFLSQFEEVMARYLPALQRALPEIPRKDLAWRLRFAVGGMVHAFGSPPAFQEIWREHCGPYDDEEMVQRLIEFMAAGIRHTESWGGGEEMP